MSSPEPSNGYELAAKILATHPDDAIETMLRCSHGTESDWLEFKAGMTLLQKDKEKGLKPDDLYWNIVKSIVAMSNSFGGALVIGVDDKHNPVPIRHCDPRGVLKNNDVDAYIRQEILDRIAPDGSKPQKWIDSKGVSWSISTKRICHFIDARHVQFRGETVVVLLVRQCGLGEEFLAIRKDHGGYESEILFRRKAGDVGGTEAVSRMTYIQDYKNNRELKSDRYAHLALQSSPTFFICHSSADEKEAKRICRLLEEKNITCWYSPNSLKGGARWADSIDDAIDSSTALLVLVSQHALASSWVYAEVNRAFTKKKTIVPVEIDGCRFETAKGGLPLILSNFQKIDASTNEPEAIEKIVETVPFVGPTPDDCPGSSSSQVAIRSMENGKFATVRDNTGFPVVAEAESVGARETFQRIRNKDGTFSFLALCNGKYASVRFDETSRPFSAVADVIELWEKFIVEENGGAVSLRTVKDGFYVQTDMTNEGALCAKETVSNSWERFFFSNVDNGRPIHAHQQRALPRTRQMILIKEVRERFLQAADTGDDDIAPIIALTDRSPLWNRFVWTCGGYFFWETVAEKNGWKLQRNKFINYFRIRDPQKVCRACGALRHIRGLLFPELANKVPKPPKSWRKSAVIAGTCAVVAIFATGIIGTVLRGTNIRTVYLENGQRIRFVKCPPGRYTMGSPDTEYGRFSNEVQRIISIKKPFWTGETEVTQGQWDSLMGGTVRTKAAALIRTGVKLRVSKTGCEYSVEDCYGREIESQCSHDSSSAPMYFVSWDDANRFCKMLTERERKRLPSGYEYRLPTEAEWEYFARAGKSSAYPNGREMEGNGEKIEPNLEMIGWFIGNSENGTGRKSVQPSGLKKPNAWGLYDVVGNVWEWCSDPYRTEYRDLTQIPDGSNRLIKSVFGRSFPEKLESTLDSMFLSKDMSYVSEYAPVGRKWSWDSSCDQIDRHVVRGGAWTSSAADCRLASRGGHFSYWGRNDIGFRVILAPTDQNDNIVFTEGDPPPPPPSPTTTTTTTTTTTRPRPSISPEQWNSYCAGVRAERKAFFAIVSPTVDTFKDGLKKKGSVKFELAREFIGPARRRLDNLVVQGLVVANDQDAGSGSSRNLADFVRRHLIVKDEFENACRSALVGLAADGNVLESELFRSLTNFCVSIPGHRETFPKALKDRMEIAENDACRKPASLFSGDGFCEERETIDKTIEAVVRAVKDEIAKATKTSKGNRGVDLEELSAKLGPRIASELVAIVNRVQIQGLKTAADCADQAKKAYLEAGDVLFKTATTRPTEIVR